MFHVRIGAITTSSPHLNNPNDLFAYTSGRYIYNEKFRLAERCVEFNVEALKIAAARSVGRNHVSRIRKLAEGGFNRAFLLTMDDGFEVVGKIPYHSTVPKTLTTESEVATLDFLRANGIPVPRVYAYSSSRDNEVGTEYMIMEKAPASPLEGRWFDLTPKERVRLVTSFVDIERKLFSIPFASYGSIYSRDLLTSNMCTTDLFTKTIESSKMHGGDRFCIGPSADCDFWRGRRAMLDSNRGPWTDHREYICSVANRELEWTRKFGRPRCNQFPHNEILAGEISHIGYIDMLEKFMSLSPFILPEDRDDPMNKPTLRHPDLNPSNVFITDTGEISCIIDWQHSSIQPLLVIAGNPPLFQNPDPEPPAGLEKPSLSADYDSLSASDKIQADELHRRRMIFWLYMVFNGKDNETHLEALRYPLLIHRQHAVNRAGRQWNGNTITLKGALLRLVQNWDTLVQAGGHLTKIQCPVHFDQKDAEEFYVLEENWFKMNIIVEHWKSLLDDIGQDGWVRHESYDKVMALNRELKAEWLAEAQDENERRQVDEYWPFQDHEEVV
ncbi:kinase-like domain-containing protein [Aspergillus stella-maris]|uniref:kinase-like domain-containing protein n=1 Tax=Aspergillus stella-maris TaxID=1810926 RepID=UPI003CCE1B38